MTKTSKRQQKHKQVQSLRSKAGGSGGQASGLDLLSDELKQQYEQSGIDPSQLVIASCPKSKVTKRGNPGSNAPQPQEELSKSQLRKLKQVQLKKERRENLSQVLAQLHTHAASDTALALMRPLHQRGHRETKKQRLRRELQLQRAGLAGAAVGVACGEGGGELLRRRRVRGVGGEGESSDSGSEQEEEGEEEKEVGGKVASTAAAAHAAAAAAGDSDGDSDGVDGGTQEEEEGEDTMEADGKRPTVPSQSEQPKTLTAAGAAEAKAAAVDPQAARAAATAAARREAARIRAHELGGVVPAVQDEQLRDPEVAAARAQAAAAAAAAAAFPHRVVHVARPAEMAAARMELPIIGQEADILEAVAAHDIVVLAGETGCGKTTQVPQFLLEAGYGCRSFPEKAGAVGITQPRRVAAVSTAERVAAELGVEIGETVGYQVRYDRCVGAATSLKFMTDGILLRQLQQDFSLAAYSAIIVDEAHERALNTDLLLGMLSRVVPLRRRLWRERQEAVARGERPTGPAVYPLKLIIMSATLRTADFTENKRLFASPPPVISVPARQYPVTVHFSRRTEMTDYVSAAFRKVTRIHSELPPGGVLVFLTGQREVEALCRRLREHYHNRKRKVAAAAAAAAGTRVRGLVGGNGRGEMGVGSTGEEEEAGEEEEDDTLAAAQLYGGGGDLAEVAGDAAERRRRGREEDVDDYQELNGDESEGDEEDVVVMGGDQFTPKEIAEAEKRFEETYGKPLAKGQRGGAGVGGGVAAAAGGEEAEGGPGPVYVLPLYAMLPQARQARVFAAHPPGHRLIIVATNVAETSLTIPGIRYVVDAGRSKQKLLEPGSGGQMARYDVRWVSKASASQRAGRAGRTCPGHAYRLYSSAHFNDTFPEHSPPEIVNSPLEGVVLVMKAMGVDKVQNFPFPTPPDASALSAAHRCLEALSALTPGSGALTELGAAMAAFPITPRHARMLLEVLRWHKKAQGEADGGVGGSGGALMVPENVARRAGRALPYAVALAAALSVESPFIHIDTVGRPEEDGEGGKGKGGKEEEEADEEEAEEEAEGVDDGGGGNTKAGKKRRGRDDPSCAVRQRRRRQQGRKGAVPAADDDEDEEEEEQEQDIDQSEDTGGAEGAEGSKRAVMAAAGRRPGMSARDATAAREAARRRRQAAAARQAAFRHPHSDALSALAALLAFEAAGESEDFATAHFLHARNLREAADLHRQLLRVLATQQATAAVVTASPGGADGKGLAEELAAVARELAAAMAVPTAVHGAAAASGGSGAALAVKDAALVLEAGERGLSGSSSAGVYVARVLPERVAVVLRRALVAGWVDQVARRMRSAQYLAQMEESRRKRHAVRYQPACLGPEEAVFLHPRSALHGDAPELLVYGSLLRTEKRPYMAGLTAVEPEWLADSNTPLCVLSGKPLPDPAPAYRPPPVDAVLAWREARYSMHGWVLPPVAAPHPEASERAAVFAAALLEGRVLPVMAELRPHLAASPAMLLRPELRGVARVGELVGALTRARVDNLASLAAAWRGQPGLLQREVAAWVGKGQQGGLLRMWGRLVQQAQEMAGGGGSGAGGGKGKKGGGGEGKKGEGKTGAAVAGGGGGSGKAGQGSKRKLQR